MAVVVVLVGQCGNQLGAALWRLLGEEHTDAAGRRRSSPFFHSDGFARCVGVDTEPKVVAGVLREDAAGQRLFRQASFATEQSGRGNNWAHGFCGNSRPAAQQDRDRPAFVTRFAPPEADAAVRALRALDDEVLRAGYVDTVIFIHSLAGGTGSGLGSRLVEAARRRYTSSCSAGGGLGAGLPDAAGRTLSAVPDGGAVEGRVMHVVSACVAPGKHGDTAVQSLNGLLALAHLRAHTDLVLLLRNDVAAAQLSAGRSGRPVNVSDLNEHLAGVLFLLLQGGHGTFAGSDLVSSLAPHPLHTVAVVAGCTFAGREQLPQFDTWAGMGKSLAAAAQATGLGRSDAVVGAAVVVGVDEKRPGEASAAAAAVSGLALGNMVAGEASTAVVALGAPLRRLGSRVGAVAVTAPDALRRFAAPLANAAMAKVCSGAYVHWYEKHGVGRGCFESAYAELAAGIAAGAALQRTARPHRHSSGAPGKELRRLRGATSSF